MFVLQSTHDKVVAECQANYKLALKYYTEFRHTMDKYNQLVELINTKGGQEFLDDAVIPQKEKKLDFSKEQLRKLIQLCHPDKHNGSALSVEVTQFLNSLKD